MKKLILFFILLPTILIAQKPKFPYELGKMQEIYFYGTGATLWGSSLLGKNWKVSLTKEDISHFSPKDVNSIDRFACYNYNNSLNNIREAFEPIGTGLAIGATATMSMMNYYREDNMYKLIVLGNIYLEGLLLTTGITQATKTYVNRARPYTYNSELSDNQRVREDNNESFFSGNSSLIFYNSVFVAKVYSDLYPNSIYTKWVWGAGLLLSCTSAYMSVQSGQHFLSDVVTGAVVGGLVGYFIPVMHYRKDFKFKKKFECYGYISPQIIPNGMGVNLAIGLY